MVQMPQHIIEEAKKGVSNREKPYFNPVLDRLIQARFRSKAKLADEVGVSRSMISKIVHGHIQPNKALQIQIAKALCEDSRTIFPEVEA